MGSRSRKEWHTVIFAGFSLVLLLSSASSVTAATIHDFIKITPYIEVSGGYDDNIFELSENASLPQEAKEREDLFFKASAGIGADITLERPFLTLGLGLNYALDYLVYSENTELNDAQHNLDFDFTFASKYEEGLVKDRLKLNIKNNLSLIPIDEEEPLYPGNRAIRNDFEVGGEYKLISTRRLKFILGYSYGRVDFENDDPVEVATVAGYENSSDLTQESQAHRGTVDFEYLLNSRLTYVMSYTYAYISREENPGELVSATFSRQHVRGGLQAKLSPRIQSNVLAGYGWTMYEDVGGLSQPDQNSFIAETNIDFNFARQPLVTIGYRKYFVENDFGDTLLTDNIFGRMGFKIARGFFVNFTGDYIQEDRDLMQDKAIQKIFGVNAEYELLKNVKLSAGYDYKNKEFFANNFLAKEGREETSHIFSGGFQYKVGRYVLLKGMYSYTDKTSDIAEQEFSRNKFTAGGKVMF